MARRRISGVRKPIGAGIADIQRGNLVSLALELQRATRQRAADLVADVLDAVPGLDSGFGLHASRGAQSRRTEIAPTGAITPETAILRGPELPRKFIDETHPGRHQARRGLQHPHPGPPDGSGVITDGVKQSINPFDEIALEEALRLREKGHADEVVVAVHRAGRRAERSCARRWPWARIAPCCVSATTALEPLDAAKTFLQAGRARTAVAWCCWASRPSTMTTTRPGRCSQALWDRPQATFASRVELDGSSARVTREVDAGLETIEVDLPAVITGGPAPQRAALREAAGHHQGQEEAAGRRWSSRRWASRRDRS